MLRLGVVDGAVAGDDTDGGAIVDQSVWRLDVKDTNEEKMNGWLPRCQTECRLTD